MRKFLIVPMFFSIALPGLIWAAQGQRLVVIDSEGKPKLGATWQVYSDKNNLGTKVNPFVVETTDNPKNAKAHAHFSGHVGKMMDPWAWAQVELPFGKDGPKDVSAYKAIRFYAKGDGKTYRVGLGRAAVKDYCQFEHPFTAPKEWALIECPLSDFAQPDWGKQIESGYKDVTSVRFYALAPGDDEDFDLHFGPIEFVGTAAKKN